MQTFFTVGIGYYGLPSDTRMLFPAIKAMFAVLGTVLGLFFAHVLLPNRAGKRLRQKIFLSSTNLTSLMLRTINRLCEGNLHPLPDDTDDVLGSTARDLQKMRLLLKNLESEFVLGRRPGSYAQLSFDPVDTYRGWIERISEMYLNMLVLVSSLRGGISPPSFDALFTPNRRRMLSVALHLNAAMARMARLESPTRVAALGADSASANLSLSQVSKEAKGVATEMKALLRGYRSSRMLLLRRLRAGRLDTELGSAVGGDGDDNGDTGDGDETESMWSVDLDDDADADPRPTALGTANGGLLAHASDPDAALLLIIAPELDFLVYHSFFVSVAMMVDSALPRSSTV